MNMGFSHLEFLVEEPSMEAFLGAFLHRWVPAGRTFGIHWFQGKSDLLDKLEDRLRSYATCLPEDWRLVVLVDRDEDSCVELKERLEEQAARAGLVTKSRSDGALWHVVNRVVVEELEAWYFGDWEAVRMVYPRVPRTIPQRRGMRDPDAVQGGTWEAFERILQRHGYFQGGLRKLEAARVLGAALDPSRNRSGSFQAFWRVLQEALSP